MKAFIVSLSIVIIFVTLIIFNAIYINRVTSDLILVANNASIDTGYEDLSNLWQRKKLVISLCAPHKEIDKIEEQIVLMGESRSRGDLQEFSKAKALFVNYVEQIQRHERLTLDNIL